MSEEDYEEMSQFVIGYDGGGGGGGGSGLDEYDGSNSEGAGGGLNADFFWPPPPPKFLLPPPPLPEFMQNCDENVSGVFNLQHHLDTCDMNFVSIIDLFSNV